MKKLQTEANCFKEIPVVSIVSKQQVLDNYYPMKIDVKKLVEEEVKAG